MHVFVTGLRFLTDELIDAPMTCDAETTNAVGRSLSVRPPARVNILPVRLLCGPPAQSLFSCRRFTAAVDDLGSGGGRRRFEVSLDREDSLDIVKLPGSRSGPQYTLRSGLSAKLDLQPTHSGLVEILSVLL